ncbi:MAG: hypothetical protein QXD48_00915 [Candidatus Aenigmatarchaeota archaeon]
MIQKMEKYNYVDPYDNMCRYELDVLIERHPELKMRAVAFGLNSYLEVDFSDEKYIPLEDLLK